MLPARGSIVGTRCSPVASTGRRRSPARKALLGSARRVQPRVCSATSSTTDFFVTSVDNVSRSSGSMQPSALVDHSPGRHLVLHVHGDLYVVDMYRGELVPTTFDALRGVSLVLPASRRRPDRARRASCCRSSSRPRDPRRVDTSRAFFLIVERPLHEGRDREPSRRAHRRRRCSRAPDRHSSLEILVAIYGYAVQIFADFCGYTDIAIGVALLLGFEFPQNFDSPVHGRLAAGLLAPLAHDAVALAARLPLHPARRQPQGTHPHLPQPAADDAARRPLARRGVDVRRSGAASTALGLAVERCATGWRPATTRAAAVARPDRHVPRRLLRVGVLPRRLVRARAGSCSSGCSRRGGSRRRSSRPAVVLAIARRRHRRSTPADRVVASLVARLRPPARRRAGGVHRASR